MSSEEALEKTVPAPLPTVDVSDPRLRLDAAAPRYEVVRRLGTGGMGVVELTRDLRIGRLVARKEMRATEHAALEARFLREARVQGQLEHPAVVPVYELAVEGGAPFFTMRRVQGLTLEEVLARVAAGDAVLAEKYSRRRLLTAFVSLCLGVDFAHSRGVLHRDLKPANLMLGDYGEAYVLDWGIARVRGATELAAPAAQPGPAGTQPGHAMGTLGYMSPEQLRGEVDRLDARTDVYALGAVLFEVLTLERLHRGDTAQQLIDSTLRAGALRPSTRRTDVPAELDELCAQALAADPAARLPSARALAEAVERFLDGEGDRERRRALALGHTEAAKAALARSHAQTATQPERLAARQQALAELGRALALDGTAPGALETLGTLLGDEPAALPPEVEAELQADEAASRTGAARVVSSGYAIGLFLVATLALGPVSHPALVWALGGALLLALATSVYGSRRKDLPRIPLSVMLTGSLVLWGLSIILGPLFLAPQFAAVACAAWVGNSTGPARRVAFALAAAAVLGPALLELGGLWGPFTAVRAGDLVVTSPAFPARSSSPWLITGANLMTVLLAGAVVGRSRDELRRVASRSRWLSWQLRQLASLAGSAAPPTAARSASSP